MLLFTDWCFSELYSFTVNIFYNELMSSYSDTLKCIIFHWTVYFTTWLLCACKFQKKQICDFLEKFTSVREGTLIVRSVYFLLRRWCVVLKGVLLICWSWLNLIVVILIDQGSLVVISCLVVVFYLVAELYMFGKNYLVDIVWMFGVFLSCQDYISCRLALRISVDIGCLSSSCFSDAD
jgi:hypothetical protein